MRKNKTIKGIMIITIIALIGVGTYAYAGWGKGYGRHGTGYGNNDSNWSEYCAGPYGIQGDLNDEDRKNMQEERKAFYEATKDIRGELYEKELALRGELAKENPDVKQAANLQKEISKLESEIDQKRLEHMINMKKINPELGRGGRKALRGARQGGGFSHRGRCW